MRVLRSSYVWVALPRRGPNSSRTTANASATKLACHRIAERSAPPAASRGHVQQRHPEKQRSLQISKVGLRQRNPRLPGIAKNDVSSCTSRTDPNAKPRSNRGESAAAQLRSCNVCRTVPMGINNGERFSLLISGMPTPDNIDQFRQ